MLKLNAIACLCFIGTIVVANAGDAQHCRTIQDAAERLKCFDDASSAPSPTKQQRANEARPRPNGGWQLEKSKDQMTDRVSCMVYPTGRRYIQISYGDLYISYSGRGGVQGFQYRVDERPASTMQLPTRIEQQIGTIHISGGAFKEVLSGNRLRVETLTMVSGIKNEDINLVGLREKYNEMLQQCR